MAGSNEALASEGLTSEVDRRARLRKRSKFLFGNADRLEVAAGVARVTSGVVHAQELGAAVGITPARVRTQLLAMVDAGVLRQLPRTGATVDYERIDDPWWDLIPTLIESWD